jgi:hypothetical protein
MPSNPDLRDPQFFLSSPPRRNIDNSTAEVIGTLGETAAALRGRAQENSLEADLETITDQTEGFVDFEEDEDVMDFDKSIATLENARKQKLITPEEALVRAEARLKTAINANPAKAADFRDISRRVIGKDPTGSQLQQAIASQRRQEQETQRLKNLQHQALRSAGFDPFLFESSSEEDQQNTMVSVRRILAEQRAASELARDVARLDASETRKRYSRAELERAASFEVGGFLDGIHNEMNQLGIGDLRTLNAASDQRSNAVGLAPEVRSRLSAQREQALRTLISDYKLDPQQANQILASTIDPTIRMYNDLLDPKAVFEEVKAQYDVLNAGLRLQWANSVGGRFTTITSFISDQVDVNSPFGRRLTNKLAKANEPFIVSGLNSMFMEGKYDPETNQETRILLQGLGGELNKKIMGGEAEDSVKAAAGKYWEGVSDLAKDLREGNAKEVAGAVQDFTSENIWGHNEAIRMASELDNASMQEVLDAAQIPEGQQADIIESTMQAVNDRARNYQGAITNWVNGSNLNPSGANSIPVNPGKVTILPSSITGELKVRTEKPITNRRALDNMLVRWKKDLTRLTKAKMNLQDMTEEQAWEDIASQISTEQLKPVNQEQPTSGGETVSNSKQVEPLAIFERPDGSIFQVNEDGTGVLELG